MNPIPEKPNPTNIVGCLVSCHQYSGTMDILHSSKRLAVGTVVAVPWVSCPAAAWFSIFDTYSVHAEQIMPCMFAYAHNSYDRAKAFVALRMTLRYFSAEMFSKQINTISHSRSNTYRTKHIAARYTPKCKLQDGPTREIEVRVGALWRLDSSL